MLRSGARTWRRGWSITQRRLSHKEHETTAACFSTEVNSAAQFFAASASTSMKAGVLWEVGGKIRTETLRMPKPKAGEVLVRTRACGVCHTDLHVIKGEVAFPLPAVLGHEITGEVVEHGPNTSRDAAARFPVGCRVLGAFIMPCGDCHFCTHDQENICSAFFDFNRLKGTLYDGTTRLFLQRDGTPLSMYSMGGLAEFCVLPTTSLAPLPSSLPFAESATLGCAMFTAYGAVNNAAEFRPGETIAVIGAGGVGMSCVQLASAFGGTTIIAVDLDESKLDRCRQLGATHVINASQVDVVDTIRGVTGGHGVDVAIEALGSRATFSQMLQCVRDGGRGIAVGIAPTGVTAPVDITRIVRRNISIKGSYGAKARKDLPTILSLAEHGKISTETFVSKRFTLDQAAIAFDMLDQREIVGRAIVDFESGPQDG